MLAAQCRTLWVNLRANLGSFRATKRVESDISILMYQELPLTARPKTVRRGVPEPDASGRCSPVVGHTAEGEAARFQVGSRYSAPRYYHPG